MSTQEFLGVTLGLILAIATAFFTLLGYKIAMKRKFHQMRRCLELASACSIMGWLVMTVVVYKYNREYTVLQQAKAFQHEPETRIAGQGIASHKTVSVQLDSGSTVKWGYGDGMRGLGSTGKHSGWVGVQRGYTATAMDDAFRVPYQSTDDRDKRMDRMSGVAAAGELRF